MWKKIIPIAAVLVLAWIVLNLFTGKQQSLPEHEVVATDNNSSTQSDSNDESSGDAVDENTSAAMSDNSNVETETVNDIAESEESTDAATDETTAKSDDSTETETAEATKKSDNTTETETAKATQESEGATETETAEATTESEDAARTEPAETKNEDASATGDSNNATNTVNAKRSSEDADAFGDAGASVAALASEGMELRYSTAPNTGLPLYDQGMVEAPISITTENHEEPVDSAEANDSEQANAVESDNNSSTEKSETSVDNTDTSESSDASETEVVTQMRYPTDPVSGATVFPTNEEDQTATETTASDTQSDSLAEPIDIVEAASRRKINDISRNIGSLFGATTSVLNRVENADSAQALLPRLESASESLEKLAEQVESLPDNATTPLKLVVQNGMVRLQPLIDASLVKPGVGEVLSPVLNPMVQQLQTLWQ